MTSLLNEIAIRRSLLVMLDEMTSYDMHLCQCEKTVVAEIRATSTLENVQLGAVFAQRLQAQIAQMRAIGNAEMTKCRTAACNSH